MRGGSRLLKTETKRKELLKLGITQRLLKTTIDPFAKREKEKRETEKLSLQGSRDLK